MPPGFACSSIGYRYVQMENPMIPWIVGNTMNSSTPSNETLVCWAGAGGERGISDPGIGGGLTDDICAPIVSKYMKSIQERSLIVKPHMVVFEFLVSISCLSECSYGRFQRLDASQLRARVQIDRLTRI